MVPQACRTYTSHLSKPLDEMCHTDYLEAIDSLTEEAREAIWFGHKARLSAVASVRKEKEKNRGREDSKSTAPALAPAQIERRDGSKLSAEEFRSQFVAPGRPVVVTGVAAEAVGAEAWHPEFISKHGGGGGGGGAPKRRWAESR